MPLKYFALDPPSLYIVYKTITSKPVVAYFLSLLRPLEAIAELIQERTAELGVEYHSEQVRPLAQAALEPAS